MRISGTDPNSYGYLLPPLSAAVKEIYGGGASNPELLIASSTEKHRVSFSLARICLKYSGVGGFLAILKAALYCTFGCSAADDPILRAMIELNAAENARVLAANRKIATDAMSLAATIEAASGNFTGIDGLFTHLQTSPLLTLTRNDINGIRKFFERIPNDEFPSFLQHSEPAKDESALITLTLSPNGKLLFLALCTFIKGGVTSFGDSEVESQVATIATRTQSVDVARPREDGTIGLGNGFIVLGRGEFIENGNHWIGGGKVPRPSQSVALTGTIVNPSAAPADD